MLTAIIVFIIVYLLFQLSGFLFPIDPIWYSSLNKPKWTPSGKAIGIIWSILYVFIALSLALVQYKVGLKSTSLAFIALWTINYLSNQAFSFFMFKLKRLDLASIDTAIVALTAFLLIFTTATYSTTAALLLIPYFLWALIATFLAYCIYFMNSD